MSTEVFNGHDIANRLKISTWVVGTFHGFGNGSARSGGDREREIGDWAAVRKAFPKVKEWATATGSKFGHGYWFPANEVADADLVWSRTDKKVKFVVGHPCEVRTAGDGSWDLGSTCARVAVEEMAVKHQFRGTRMTWVCGIHRGAQKRLRANDEMRQAEADERKKRWDNERSLTQASRDWAERLQKEYGVKAYGMQCSGTLRTAVEPEDLYRLLSTADGLLRDAGLSWGDVTDEADRDG